MKTIESIIHQKKFKDEYVKALIGTLYYSNLINNYHTFIFKKFKITRQQYNVLRILRGQYPNQINIKGIKERMIDKNSDASRLVVRLAKMKLIKIIESKTDKRAMDIIIANDGFKLLNQIDEFPYQTEAPFKALNEDEIKTFNTLISKLINTFEHG